VSNSRALEAYGATLLAALRVELALRVINSTRLSDTVRGSGTSAKNIAAKIEKEIRNATAGTYGQVVKRFVALHQGEVEPDFVEYLEQSVGFRNYISHTFLQAHIINFMFDRGLEIVRLECESFIKYFYELEAVLLNGREDDFGRFIAACSQVRAAAEPHPFDHLLQSEFTETAAR
jgi:hypothetical protein